MPSAWFHPTKIIHLSKYLPLMANILKYLLMENLIFRRKIKRFILVESIMTVERQY